MFARINVFLSLVGLLFLVGVFFSLIGTASAPTLPTPAQTVAVSAATGVLATTSVPAKQATSTSASSSAPKKKKLAAAVTKTPVSTPAAPTSSRPATTSDTVSQVARIENPYITPPESMEKVNTDARAALVNILCMSRGSQSPISGSGVFIDARGVILTNAHVAQYVLLSQSSAVDLSCFIRSGSPARILWTARVLYMPTPWVLSNASKLNTEHPMGTGEYDYALLLVTGSADGASLPNQFPYLESDTREAIGFPGDQVLAASYPAEFVGGLMTERNLFAASSPAIIGKLLTFGTGSVDVISLGGIIAAQGGSSGGPVVNPWGKLIGLITTTSDGRTTAERDLQAISLSYINTDLRRQAGKDLSSFLQGDLAAMEHLFRTQVLPGFLKEYTSRIKPSPQI